MSHAFEQIFGSIRWRTFSRYEMNVWGVNCAHVQGIDERTLD